MRSASEGRDWFPVILFATFVGFAASAVLLMLLGHGWLAMATTGAAALVALPLAGWLVAGPAVALREENVGRVLALFVKLYARGRRRARGSDRPN